MCAKLGGVICSVLDQSEQEEVRLHQLCCQMLPLLVYEGTWTHSPPLVAMHLLDRSCMSVGFFYEIVCYVPQQCITERAQRYLFDTMSDKS